MVGVRKEWRGGAGYWDGGGRGVGETKHRSAIERKTLEGRKIGGKRGTVRNWKVSREKLQLSMKKKRGSTCVGPARERGLRRGVLVSSRGEFWG